MTTFAHRERNLQRHLEMHSQVITDIHLAKMVNAIFQCLNSEVCCWSFRIYYCGNFYRNTSSSRKMLIMQESAGEKYRSK